MRAAGGRVGPAKVIGILGPTGVGKTAVGVELGRRLAVRVISCDSMQVYRGFPVLTNQPTGEETGEVAHELLGYVEPGGAFSAAEYAASARPLIDADVRGPGWALVVGGTGLYMRAALAPLAVGPGSDPALRASLEERAAGEGAEALHGELSRLDPAAARSIDPRNARRVVRALEAVLLTGHEWSGRGDLWSPVYDHPTVLVGLVTDRADLDARINARAARMLNEGAVEEVLRFRRERGPENTMPGGAGIRSAIGYREICGHLEGWQSLQETAEQIATATRRYARRQLTWLRKVRDAVIIDVHGREPHETADIILELASVGERPEEPKNP